MGDYFYQGLSKPASLERSHVSLGLNFVRYPLGVGVKGKLVQGGAPYVIECLLWAGPLLGW